MHSEWRCNGKDECGDDSDERDCFHATNTGRLSLHYRVPSAQGHWQKNPDREGKGSVYENLLEASDISSFINRICVGHSLLVLGHSGCH